jgi:histidinol-phosphate phosphatase family protein
VRIEGIFQGEADEGGTEVSIENDRRPGVLLDRDGTIIEDHGYIGSVDRVRLLDGAAEAVAALNAADIPVAVVTNQAGVARGFYGVEDIRAVHAHLDDLLAREGAHIDAWLFCPYHPDGIVEEYARGSSDRKPAPGMALAAAQRLGLDLGHSWVVGDSQCDIELALGVGARPIRIGELDDEIQVTTVPSLAAAVSHILADQQSREGAAAEVLTFPQMRYDSAYLFAEHYSHELAQALATVDVAAFDRASKVLGDAYDRDAAVFVCGNGGSASIANHLQCDHIKGVRVGTDLRTRVTSLSTNVEILSAIANDIGYDAVFEFQLESLARPGDVLVAVSSSGRSPNIVRALRWAEDHGLQTIAMTGFGGGEARTTAGVSIHVDAHNYGIVEDAHQACMHLLAQFARQSRMEPHAVAATVF